MAGVVGTEGGDTVGLMKKGRIWAIIADTATTTYGTAAALILSGDNVGKLTDTADSEETSKVALTGVTFTGKADTDNGIAVVEMK